MRLSYLLEGVFVKGTRKMGRGVFTEHAIQAGQVVEIAPVVVMDHEARKLLDQTLLHDYIFEWGELIAGAPPGCCMALGLIPIYNHSYQSNCEYEMDFKKEIITVKAVRQIRAGEQLFINYNGDWDSEKKVWFETK